MIVWLCLILLSTDIFANRNTLLLATTTSLEDTGFLDYLIPKFENDAKINVKWIAIGSGAALELGKNCDVDVILTHDPDAEKNFIASDYGIGITKVMYNDFVIVGSVNDPAHIKNKNIVDALSNIEATRNIFISRGDRSGTAEKELELWRYAHINLPQKSVWYLQSGQGMIATLNMADAKKGYTLTDRATFLKYISNSKASSLEILVQNQLNLFNQYNVIVVNPKYCKNVNAGYANQFKDWLISVSTKKLIADFKVSGKQVFFSK